MINHVNSWALFLWLSLVLVTITKVTISKMTIGDKSNENLKPVSAYMSWWKELTQIKNNITLQYIHQRCFLIRFWNCYRKQNKKYPLSFQLILSSHRRINMIRYNLEIYKHAIITDTWHTFWVAFHNFSKKEVCWYINRLTLWIYLSTIMISNKFWEL